MWQREIEVDVAVGGVIKYRLRGLHFHFKYEGRLGWTADQCRVDIYNLDVDTVMGLMSGTVQEQEVQVFLRAGYEDEREEGELPTVLVGVVMNVFSRRLLPNYITTLYCVPLAAASVSKKQEQTVVIPRNTTVDGAFTILKNKFKLTQHQYFGVPDATKNIKLSGMDLAGPIRTMYAKVARAASCHVKFTSSEVRIISRLRSADTISYITSQRGARTLDIQRVKGVPSTGMGTIDVPYVMDASIEPGMVMDVTALQSQDASRKTSGVDAGFLAYSVDGTINPGTGNALFRDEDVFRWAVKPEYQIFAVVHEGSTHIDVWDSTINGIVYNPGTNGANE